MKPTIKTINVHGVVHVVKEVKRPNVVKTIFGEQVVEKMYQPNYRGSGLALCGILKPGQTLEQFIEN